MNDHAFSRGDLLFVMRARALASSGRAREIRLAARLTLHEMAELLDVHLSTLHAWERGARRPGRDAAARYGRLLADLEAEMQLGAG